MDSRYIKILEYFGKEHQEKKLVEEVLELILALHKVMTCSSPKLILEAQEEIADCFIVMRQLYGHSEGLYEVLQQYVHPRVLDTLKWTYEYIIDDSPLIELMVNVKLTRTIDRIESGYYKTHF